jgi:STE24 endopeptidase
MNTIAVIIVAALVADWVLHLAGDIFNLNHLRPAVPEDFADVINDDRYRLSQHYLKARTHFGWLVSTFHLVVILLFWFNGGFNVVDQWVRSFGWGPIASGLLFIGILVLLRALLSLPFSCYATFALEARFGFNRTTLKTFVSDLVKGFFLAMVLGVPVMALVLAFFEHAGPGAWLYCWAAVTLFTLLVQFIAPTFIMPLFNRYTPLDEGKLRTAILDYARSIDFPLQNIFVMDGSRRSTKSNAFFTGFGRNKRIVLFDTLIQQHTVDELVAVLAHEMGHYKKKHILKSIFLGILQTGLLFFLVSIFLSYQPLFDAFHMQQTSIYAGLLFFGLLYTPVDFFTGLILQIISRRHERDADRFAVKTTGAPEALVDALKKLSAHNLSNLRPHPFYVFLNYSHPPVLERIRAIRRHRGSEAGYAPA